MSTIIKASDYDSSLNRVTNLGFTSETARERKYEPQTQNTFSFQFLFDEGQVAYIATQANKLISNMVGGEKIAADNYHRGLSQINDALNASIQGLTSPTKTIGTILVDFFNTQVKYAGKPTYNTANINFNTFIGLGTKNILSAWAELAQSERNQEGGWARSLDLGAAGIALPQNNGDDNQYLDALFPLIGYKCDGLLLECARDGTIVNAWDYIGMWVSAFTPGSFTMAGANSPSQVSATITVDKIKQSDTQILTSKINY